MDNQQDSRDPFEKYIDAIERNAPQTSSFAMLQEGGIPVSFSQIRYLLRQKSSKSDLRSRNTLPLSPNWPPGSLNTFAQKAPLDGKICCLKDNASE